MVAQDNALDIPQIGRSVPTIESLWRSPDITRDCAVDIIIADMQYQDALRSFSLIINF